MTLRSASAARHEDATMSTKFAEVAPRAGRGRGRGRGRRNHQEQQQKLFQEKVVASIPASAVFTQLQEFERRVDATLARKKAEVNEALKSAPRDPRTVRIYVYNTWKEANPAEGEDASWTLHVQGRVLAPHECADGTAGGDYDPETEPKFSEFVRSVEIRLDPASAPPPAADGAAPAEESDEPIRWESDKAPADAKPVDGFEVKRVGNTDRKAKILIAVKHKPERYKPKPELSRLLGLDLETRPRLIAALWQYCRLNDLLDKEDATLVALDDRLRSLFYKGSNGEKQSAKFVDLCEMMCAGCLDPAPPVELDYVVRTRGRKNPTHPDCYDLLGDVPGGDKAPHIFVEGIGRDAEIAALDAKIQAGIKKIEKHLQRRSYFLGFSHSPVDFINTVVAQQARDIAIVRNDGRKRRLAERRTEFYNKPWVDEAVMQYVTRQSKAGKI